MEAAFVNGTPVVRAPQRASAVTPSSLRARNAFLAAAPLGRRAPRAVRASTVPKMVTEVTEELKQEGKLQQTGDPWMDKCINTIRFLAIDAVETASSGHPGMPMGMAPSAQVLWDEVMHYNPKNPDWVNRDRFVLSAGHGSMLLYAMLYLFGYDSVTMDDIKKFRTVDSCTPGHPENFETKGVEVTTGPLGQGISNAVGIAAAEAHLAAQYNKPDHKIIDHYTYVIAGDGCMMEGVASEASSLAGHLGLGKLIVLYDDNKISIDGHTSISFTEDVALRYEAYGWHVLTVPQGNTNVNSLRDAIKEAQSITDRPTMIRVTTIIGYGSPNKSDSHDAHGAALGKDEVTATREYLEWPYGEFEVPDDVLEYDRRKIEEGAKLEADWQKVLDSYKKQYPELGEQFQKLVVDKQLPDGWEEKVREFGEKSSKDATRKLSHGVLNVLAEALPNFVGGSADLAPSNLTLMKCTPDFQKASPEGRNFRFGVREHGMGAISTGLNHYAGGLVPFCATFFIFTDYMRAAIRMAALSQAGVIYTMTHDSIFLGEDGPTHQPIEHMAAFRAMPNIYTYRPADGVEVAAAYAIGVASRTTPTLLALTRQGVPRYEESSYEGTKKGGYVLTDNTPSGQSPDLILIGTGSEVELVYEAAKTLREKGKNIRVVSMPCTEVFDMQDESYRESVLPSSVSKDKRLAVEAMCSFGWDRYAHKTWTINRFGVSGKGPKIAEKFGFTIDNVTKVAEAML